MKNTLHTDIGGDMEREDRAYRQLEALMDSYAMTDDASAKGAILFQARQQARGWHREIVVANGRLVFKTRRAQ